MKYNRQLVREKVNIVEYVSRYVALRKSGKNHLGLCPFHTEKTPSFTVNEQKQIFHCFGCGAGGDVVEFLSKMLKLGFHETVMMLEKETGLTIMERDPEYEKRIAEIKRITDINREALRFFLNQLFKTDGGAEALRYLHDRKVPLDIIRRFHLGYGGREWDRLARHLERKEFGKADIERSGLVIAGATSRRDFFRNRLVFPIVSHRNEIVGFGGRALDASLPKYINTQENVVFSKRRNLYGIHLAREAIVREKSVFIVEGYMDCIMMHHAGFENTVATLGTSLTEEHIRFLRGMCDNYLLLFDGDDAGRKAGLRAVETFLNQGISPSIVLLPEGEDPDSLVASGRVAELKEALGKSQNAIDFLISYYKMKYSLHNSDGIRSFVNGVAAHARNIKDSLEIALIVRAVAVETGIPADEISGRFKAAADPAEKTVVSQSRDVPAEGVVAHVITHPADARFVDGDVRDELGSELREILDCCVAGGDDHGLGEAAAALYRRLAVTEQPGDGDPEKGFRDNVIFLKRRRIKKMKEELNALIREYEQAGDSTAITELLNRKKQIAEKEKELQRGL